MSRNISAGIDVGTSQVKVVIAESTSQSEKSGLPRIIGVGKSESSGLRHGYIINTKDATDSIRKAIEEAERNANIKIREAFLSVGGVSIDSTYGTGSTVVSRADQEITDIDVDKVIHSAKESLPQAFSLNQKIVHVIPLAYKVDQKDILGSPIGMKGSKLDVKVMFVSCLEGHLNDLIGAVEEAGVEVQDVMASPFAGSLPILSKTQKMAGCVLANIGAETVSIIVYENDIPIALKVFPIGSTDITHDIALGLKIDIEKAEKIKLGGSTDEKFSKKKLDEIIEARLTDIFELIENHLKKIGKSELLPAGIIISGGGSGLGTIEDIARALLKIPSRRAGLPPNTSARHNVKDSGWAVAYGMCIWALEPEDVLSKKGLEVFRKTKSQALSWIRRFLP